MRPAGLLSQLVRRNGLLILAFTAAGLLQWAYIKIVAVSQPAGEFGRFVAMIHFAMILTTPVVSLQGAVSRQVASLIARGRPDALLPYLHRRLRSWLLPIGGVAAAVLVLSGPLAARFDLGGRLGVILLTGILLAYLPFQACLGFLAGADRFRALAGLLVLDTGLRCLLALLSPGLVATTSGALLVSLIAMLVAVGAGLLFVRRGHVPPAPGSDPDDGLERTLPAFVAAAVAFSLVAYQETLLVRLVLSPDAAGDYAAAIVISRLLLVIAYPLVPAMVPLVTKREAAGEGTRRVLLFHHFVLAGPAVVFVASGFLVPDLLGGLLLDADKHSGLGPLLPLAFTAAALLAAGYLSLHYLLALRRFAVVPVLAASALGSAALILTAQPEPRAVLVRMTWMAGGICVLTTAAALLGPARRRR